VVTHAIRAGVPRVRIAIDARELAGQPTGVGRYLTELLRVWRTLPAAADHDVILCAPDGCVVPEDVPPRTSLATAPGSGTRWEQIALRRLLHSTRADVLFAPAYSGPLWCPVPMVLTVHDVSFAAHPEWFSWREGTRRRVLARLAASQAVRVLTLSEFSRREIVERLGVAPARVEAVPLGVPPRAVTKPAPRNDTREPDPRILYVGTLFNRRHIPALVEGFARFAATRPGARLDIVGSNRTRPWIDVEALAAASPARARIRVRSYVSGDELSSLYDEAAAFVFLSEYEGFGLTPLEALAAGVPVAVLDTPVAREVYGGAALYLERPDPALVAGALEELIGSSTTRARLLAEADTTLARYSWKACAERTLQAIVESGAAAR
jgi:glycosyltransferase involved in cell wall biosynthesis